MRRIFSLLLPACLSLGGIADVAAGPVPTAAVCRSLIANAEHRLKHTADPQQQSAAERLLVLVDAACGAVAPASDAATAAAIVEPTATHACQSPAAGKQIAGAVNCSAGAGGFSGRVTAVASGFGLADGFVGVFNSSGVLQKLVSPASDGNYSATGLLPGTYYANTSPGGFESFLAEGYSDVACPSGFAATSTGLGSCSPANLTPLVVSAGSIRPNINFVLSNNTGFSGRVSSAGSGLSGGFVSVYNANGVLQTFVPTDGSGDYRATGLVAGSYYATTSLGAFVEHLAEGYNDVPCPSGFASASAGVGSCSPANLTPIVVAANTIVPNINFVLSNNSGFTGRVSSGGVGLANGVLGIYNVNGVLQKFVFTDPLGDYRATGLLAGNHYAVTSPGSLTEYLAEANGDVPCPSGFAAASTGLGSCSPANISPIVVSAGNVTSNVNFVLSNNTGFRGRVSSGGVGLDGVVAIYNASGALQKFVFTDSNGDYRATGLLSGAHYAVTDPGAFVDYLAEGHNDVPCPSGFAAASSGVGSCSPANLTAINVSAGSTLTNINFSLSNNTGFSGRVTDAGNGIGLGVGLIVIHNASGALQKFVFTDANGDYRATGLLPGSHYAVTTAGSFVGHLAEAYRDVPCPSGFATSNAGLGSCSPTNSTPINVVSGQITNNIHFTLCRLSESLQVFANGFER